MQLSVILFFSNIQYFILPVYALIRDHLICLTLKSLFNMITGSQIHNMSNTGDVEHSNPKYRPPPYMYINVVYIKGMIDNLHLIMTINICIKNDIFSRYTIFISVHVLLFYSSSNDHSRGNKPRDP